MALDPVGPRARRAISQTRLPATASNPKPAAKNIFELPPASGAAAAWTTGALVNCRSGFPDGTCPACELELPAVSLVCAGTTSAVLIGGAPVVWTSAFAALSAIFTGALDATAAAAKFSGLAEAVSAVFADALVA